MNDDAAGASPVDVSVGRPVPERDTYDIPQHGWTCFHCGETFTTVGGARTHFGGVPDVAPGCVTKVELGAERGLLTALRKAEDECRRAWAAVHDETTDAHKAMRDAEPSCRRAPRSRRSRLRARAA